MPYLRNNSKRKSMRQTPPIVPQGSPRNNLVDDAVLFGTGSAKVDACRFDAFMSHEIGQERDVIELLQKVLGETVTERMWVDDRRIQLVLDG